MFRTRDNLPETRDTRRLDYLLIRPVNRAFWKRPSKRRNLKTPALRCNVDGKHFENGTFRKQWRHDNHVIFLPEFSASNTNLTWPVIGAFANSSGVMWTESIRCVIRVKKPFSNFLQRSVRRGLNFTPFCPSEFQDSPLPVHHQNQYHVAS